MSSASTSNSALLYPVALLPSFVSDQFLVWKKLSWNVGHAGFPRLQPRMYMSHSGVTPTPGHTLATMVLKSVGFALAFTPRFSAQSSNHNDAVWRSGS